jgi:alcohol dehydrogenase (cytochrome c)
MRIDPLLLLATTPLVAIGSLACREARGSERWASAADESLLSHIAPAGSWASYGRDLGNRRYSPLQQINTGNVAELKPVWVYHSGIPHASESNPVVWDGTLYLSTALNHVVALDARNGRKRWEYAHDLGTTVDCCAGNNKGVTVYDGKVYMATLDARLVALDAGSGRKVWDVPVGENDLGYHMTGTPLAIDGKIITGVSGGEQGCRCYVDAYDARTGRLQWRWYTIPSPAQGGWWGTWREQDEWGQSFSRDIAREKADSAKYTDAWLHGGGPMWHHPAYDPKLRLVFLNIGNPAPDLDGSVRPGDNLYTNSIVALEVGTGRLRWYYQQTPHDVWDYDATSPPVLVTVRDNSGRQIPAVAEASKNGFVYVLDRATGRPIRKSEPFVPLKNYMVRPDSSGLIVSPGTLGGSDWSPTAYDSTSGYLYVDGNYFPMLYKPKRGVGLKAPAQWWGGTTVPTPGEKHYGLFSAVDLNTGKIAWQQKVSSPLISGALVTAGEVVFTGASDKQFLAFDAHSGEPLWRFKTEAGVNAPPITYELDGVQYVAVATTGSLTLNSPRGDALLVFALPPKARSGA